MKTSNHGPVPRFLWEGETPVEPILQGSSAARDRRDHKERNFGMLRSFTLLFSPCFFLSSLRSFAAIQSAFFTSRGVQGSAEPHPPVFFWGTKKKKAGHEVRPFLN